MKNLSDFIAASLEAAGTSEPINNLTELLEKTIKQGDWLTEVLPETDEDETLLYASKELTIYSINLTPGLRYPPHSHEMPVIIGFYQGCETNLFYEEQSNGELSQSGRIDFEAPCVGQLETDTIHSITNYGQSVSRAIHYYLGDLLNQSRRLWNPDSNECMKFNNTKYFEYAKPNPASTSTDWDNK